MVIEYPKGVSDSGYFISMQFYERKDVDKLIVETYKASKQDFKKKPKSTNKNKNKTVPKCKGMEQIKVVDDPSALYKVANRVVTKTLLSELILKDTINLYIPNNMDAKHEANIGWTLESTGVMGLVINALKETGDIKKAIENNAGVMAKEGVKGLIDMASGKAGKIVREAERVLSQIHGVKPKKDDELMFLSDVTARAQTLSFRFMPRNKDEYELIKLLTETVLLNTYPDLGQWGIDYPPVVQLRVYFGGKLVLGYRNMQIEDIQIPIMPEGFEFYSDGNPAIIDMQVSLKEGGKYYRKHYLEDAKKIYTKNKG